MYLKYLLGLFKGWKIGLIYDHEPAHVSTEVMDWIKEYNIHAPKRENLVVEFVDLCLNSNYQTPYVVMKTPLKRLVQREYHDHISFHSASSLYYLEVQTWG